MGVGGGGWGVGGWIGGRDSQRGVAERIVHHALIAAMADAQHLALACLQVDLNGNLVTTLPEEVCSLVSLRRLRLNANCLREIPSAIGLLTALKVCTVGDATLVARCW